MLGNILRAFNHAMMEADGDDEEQWNLGAAQFTQHSAEVDRARELLATSNGSETDCPERASALDSLAQLLEAAEAEYSTGEEDPYINGRENHLIGALLHFLFESGDAVYDLFEHHILEAEAAVQDPEARLSPSTLAALRLLLAGCPGCLAHPLSSSQRRLLDFLRRQRVLEALVSCVKTESTDGLQVGAMDPRCCRRKPPALNPAPHIVRALPGAGSRPPQVLCRLCSTGIVAAAVTYAEALDAITNMRIVPALLPRLHAVAAGRDAAALLYRDQYRVIGAESAEACVTIELRAILSCLSTMVEFPEFPEVPELEKEVRQRPLSLSHWT